MFVLYPIENRCRFVPNRGMACEDSLSARSEPGGSISKPGIIPEETGKWMKNPDTSGSQLFWMVSPGRMEAAGDGCRNALEKSGRELFSNRE